MNSHRKIAAHFTLCPHTGWIPRAVLTFDREGRLLSIESDVSRMDSLQGIEFYSGVLVPGVVNAHCHLELSYMQGVMSRGSGLAGFVQEIGEKRLGVPDPERIHAADLQESLMRQEGVVAVGDICNDPLLFPLKARQKIHYHNFVELFGIDPAQAARAFAHGLRTAGVARELGLPYSIIPHSTYSVSEALFGRIAAANEHRSPLSIHFMESRAEKELFHGFGAFAERYGRMGLAVDLTAFGSPAGRLIASLPGDTPLLLIHNTFVTEEEIDLIQSHFQSVTWVVCPRSNDYIEGAFPPLELLRRKGCRIAVGTDGLSSNTTLSLLDELKYISGRATIPMDELMGWATTNGAQALGIGDWAGSLEVGKTPGAVLIDHIDWKRLSLTSESTARQLL